MSTRTQRKYTTNGFPKSHTKDEYNQDEVVWVLISDDLPYWPAQIKTGGTIFSTKKRKNTKGLSKLPVVTFNDPDFSVIIQTKDDIINETTKPKKRKKDCTKRRSVARSKVLKWEEKRENDEEITYNDILTEYVKRKKLANIEAIDESIFKQWNDIALNDAEQELKRMADLKRLEAQRRLEHDQLQKALEEEMHKQRTMKNQIYDGRKYNAESGEKEGWELRAGDIIRYWPSNNIANNNNIIETKIIKVRDLYGTLRLKDTVPIDVECDANPPFWNTEIQKLPERDSKYPVFYPLRQCLFQPSQIENEMEKEHEEAINEFKKDLKNKGWGNMLYDTETCTNNEKKKKKKNRKRKRITNDEENATDSDVVILNNKNTEEENRNIINKKNNIQFSFEKKKKRKQRVHPVHKNNTKTAAPQPRKKRRLNKPNTMTINGSDEEEDCVMKNTEEDCTDKMDEDTSEDEPLQPYLQGLKAVDSDDNIVKDSDCEIIKVKPAEIVNITGDVIEESESVIPWPEPHTKLKKKKKSDSGKKSKRKIRSKVAEKKSAKQKKQKRKPPNFKQKKATPKKRSVVFTNYVDDGCCPQMMKSREYHDDLCVNKGCDDREHLFMSGNGSFIANNHDMPHSLCLSQQSTTSASTFAYDYCSESSSSSIHYMDDAAQKKVSKKKKKNKGKMSDIASLRKKEAVDDAEETKQFVHKLDTLITRQKHTKVQSPDTNKKKKGSNKKKKKLQRKRSKNNKEIKDIDALPSEITNQLEALFAFGDRLTKS